MRHGIKLMIFIILGLGLVACSPTPKPQEFKSEPGRFSVVSPVPLKETIKPVETQGAGKIDLHIFMGQQSDIGYVASYADYPQRIVEKGTPEKILDGACKGMVSNVNGKLVLESKTEVDGYPGRELVIEVMIQKGVEGTVKARVFLVGNRIYQMMWIAPKGKASHVASDDFLKSFRLIGK
jgi:hypothetical protein